MKTTISVSEIEIDDTPTITSSGKHHAYKWTCPNCGDKTFAFKEENTTPEKIAADPLCYVCRKALAALDTD